ncbi:poly polymerase [Aspergillus ambiguus]|uniref:putative poly(ADP)-ribose polymerase PARP n=1 Tax=Aspergillus ambiguus TaxID=176160 RepID=UPI003CCCECA8
MATGLLKDFVIAVSGTFPGYRQAELRSMIKSHGATFSQAVTNDCTHLITTQREIDNKNSKYKQAFKVYNCNIVSLDWLIESDQAKKLLPEKSYTLGPKPKDSKKSTKDDDDTDKPQQKKRTLEEALEIEGDTANKKPKDGQKSSSKSLNVPVDEGCYMSAYRSVHIDDSGVIWDATLNQTVAANNNNKFYRIQLLAGADFMTWTRWGRVGETGQHAMLGDGSLDKAMTEFKKKFKDKSGLTWENRLDPPKKGKYTFIEKNYEEEDEEEENGTSDATNKQEIESVLPVPVQDLMSFIFNKDHFLSAMASMSYDAQKLPLGKLSKRTLRAGFQLLKDLSELMNNPNLASSKYNTSLVAATTDLSDQYFTTIPHVFGRNRPPVLNSEQHIKRELELLEALTDMEVADGIMKDSKDADTIHQLDSQFQSLNMKEMTPLNRASTEFKELEAYLQHSRGSTHNIKYTVINIFRIEREGENDRFMSSKYANIKKSNRRLLWHGSRSTNFGGILSQGLRIAPPEAPSTGYAFGKGVYFADMSSKSANYCCHRTSANMGLLLLCDVELGERMLELDGGNFNADKQAKEKGLIATLGKGTTIPGGWKDAGCLQPALQGVSMPDVEAPFDASNVGNYLRYNEYIVYDVAQIRQRYLFQVHM